MNGRRGVKTWRTGRKCSCLSDTNVIVGLAGICIVLFIVLGLPCIKAAIELLIGGDGA